MNIELFAPARVEFAEAVRHYETQRLELGDKFAAEVQRTIDRILQYPEAWSLLSRRTRRCPTNRFPHGIIYQVRGDTLLICTSERGQGHRPRGAVCGHRHEAKR